MGSPHANQVGTHPDSGLQALCLAAGIWVAAFLFLTVLVDVRVFYEAGPWFPCFSRDAAFCLAAVARPGGAVELADAFVAQWDYYGWPSALVLAALVALLAMWVAYLLGRVLGGTGRLWAYPVAALALMAFGRYGRHGAPLLGLTLALGVAALHAAWHGSSRGARFAQFLVLDALVYYVAGGPALAFVLFCAAGEFCVLRDEPLGGAMLLAGCAMPLLVGVAGFGLPTAAAFVRLLPMYAPAHYQGLLPLSLLYALLVALCAWAVLRVARRAPPEGQAPAENGGCRRGWLAVVRNGVCRLHCPCGSGAKSVGRGRGTVLPPQSSPHRDELGGDVSVASGPTRPFPDGGRLGKRRWLATILPPVVALGAVAASIDGQRGLEMRLRRAARFRNWDQVLALATHLREREPALETIYCTNQALLHSGRLLDGMFSFPQASLGLTLGMALDVRTLTEVIDLRRWLYFDLGDTTLELGWVNEAEHEACEMLTWAGPHPTVLLQLARIYTVKGNLPAVEHVLSALAKDVVHGAPARAWLRRLRAGSAPTVSLEVEAIRRHRVATDVVDVGMDVLRRCELLLAADPHNRLAADCLLGQYLLERDVEAAVRNLGRLRDVGYTALPRHLQEAVVLQEALQNGRADCQGWAIDPELRAAYQRFAAAFQPFYAAGDAAAARRALGPEFGESFFYYYACGRSPGMPK